MPLERICNPDDRPRSLGERSVRERREALLNQPHVRALTRYVYDLREQGLGEVPYFDPLDGGINARVLFLFEKPGPMTLGSRSGSGFISRNNDDRSAEATFHFMARAGIPRGMTVTWNVVPWWNGTPSVRAAELRQGAREVRNLIMLLPHLQAVVFVGEKAKKARRYLKIPGLTFFSSAHPSPKVQARWPALWQSIPSDWAQVTPILGLK